VRILVDTECWLWALSAPERLGRQAEGLLEEHRYPLFVSAASLWEVAIKYGTKKVHLPAAPQEFLPAWFADMGIDALPIAARHALHVASLPPLHNDPFDRLLVAQAQLERLTLLTADAQLLLYDVETMWAGREPPPRVHRPRSRRSR
jgi:PIN domain nuclease of toxin-antitoxin system